jgi:hypothetical protein
MYGLTKENTRRPVELGYNHTFRTVDYKSALGRHIGNSPQIDVLNYGFKILMVLVIARQLKLSLQGHSVGQTPFNTLLDGVSGWVHEIVEELKNKVIAGVRNRKILSKNLEKALIGPVIC